MSEELYKKYIKELKEKKKKDGDKWVVANEWALKKTDVWFSDCYKKIETTGLVFDGVHITINERGVSFDYVAYKNKMLLAYPESLLDVQLVYKDDELYFEKDSGKVIYKHIIKNPFNRDIKDIVGGYMVIKNKRGDFLTILSKSEVDKCKQIAKTQNIWRDWYAEMALKTIIKKAVKLHFDDIFAAMEEEDNKNYDVEKTVCNSLDEDIISDVYDISSLDELKSYYNATKDSISKSMIKEFNALITAKKGELNANS